MTEHFDLNADQGITISQEAKDAAQVTRGPSPSYDVTPHVRARWVTSDEEYDLAAPPAEKVDNMLVRVAAKLLRIKT